MKTIYFFDAQGNKVYFEVSDEIAAEYQKCRQEEWRSDAYEHYYTQSLEQISESGHEFGDEDSDLEKQYFAMLDKEQHRKLLIKLKKVLPQLTDVQRATVHKLFIRKMSPAEIADEEKVARSTMKERIDGIYTKLRKLIEKN